MADIQRYLDDILAAVYGEDVRGSIHDAIEIINDVSEVVMSSGTAVTGPTSSSTGFYEDSFYLNTNTYELWKCVGTDTWVSLGVLRGNDGRSIVSILKTGTLGDVDTYTITYSDSTTSTFTVTNGKDGRGIYSISKTSTVGLVDTYTIVFTDMTSTSFMVTNGKDGENGSKWYKGTALSGTGTGITGFPANKDDYYLNSTTGMVYVCTKSGAASAPDAAEWEYVMTLSGGGGSSVTVVDNLNSTSTTDALSANQGRNLNQKKIEKPSSPSAGDVLGFDGTDWIATAQAGGHNMTPTPASGLDIDDVRTAMTAAETEGSENDDVMSAWAVGQWANTLTKEVIYNGTIAVGDNTIGDWLSQSELEALAAESNLAVRAASEATHGWWHDDAFVGIDAFDDYRIEFTRKVGKDIITLGGYIIDTDTGYMCVKFGAPTTVAGNKVGVEITVINNGVSYGPN